MGRRPTLAALADMRGAGWSWRRLVVARLRTALARLRLAWRPFLVRLGARIARPWPGWRPSLARLIPFRAIRLHPPSLATVAAISLVSIIVEVALVLRLLHLGEPSLGPDEATLVEFSSRPFLELLRLPAGESAQPPLYPMLLHTWMDLVGRDEFALRLLSALAGTALLPLLYLAGKQLEVLALPGNRPSVSLAGLVAATLAAVSSFQVGYSRETSDGMVATFLALLSCYLLLAALAGRHALAWWMYAPATAAALYSQNAALLLVPLQMLFVATVARSRWRVWLRWLVAVGSAGVAYLFWVANSEEQYRRIVEAAVGWDFLLLLSPLLYLILAWAITRLLRAAGSRGTPLLSRLVLPCLGVVTLVCASAVSAVYAGPTESGALGVGADARQQADYRALVAYVESHARPGDAVLLMRAAYQPFAYYSRLQLPRYGIEPFDDFEGTVARLNQVAEEHRRLWLVLWQKERVDPANFVLHVMKDQAREVPVDSAFGDVGLRLFELAAGSRFTYYPRVAHTTEAIFGGKLQLWGWNVSRETVAAGEVLQFDLYWRPLAKIGSDLRATLSMLDRDGHPWAQTDEFVAGPSYPTTRWREEQIVHDHHRLQVVPGTTAGDYKVELRIYDPASPKPLETAEGSAGNPTTSLLLQRLAVTPTPPSAFEAGTRSLTQPPPPRPSLRTLSGLKAAAAWLLAPLGEQEPPAVPGPSATWDVGGDRLELLQSLVGRRYAQPWDAFEVVLDWRAPAALTSDYAAHIALMNWKGQPLADQVFPMVPGNPAYRWRPGEPVLARYWFSLPGELPTGKYEVVIAPERGLEKALPALRYTHLSDLEIPDIASDGKLPKMQKLVGVRLGGKAELAGFDLSDTRMGPGDDLRLTLYWRALESFGRSYQVFVHLMDEQGVLASQRGGLPVANSRPTTTWREGDVFVDRYEIPISRTARPGSYSLKVGMAAQEGGQRLPVVNEAGLPSGDSIDLGVIEVGP